MLPSSFSHLTLRQLRLSVSDTHPKSTRATLPNSGADSFFYSFVSPPPPNFHLEFPFHLSIYSLTTLARQSDLDHETPLEIQSLVSSNSLSRIQKLVSFRKHPYDSTHPSTRGRHQLSSTERRDSRTHYRST